MSRLCAACLAAALVAGPARAEAPGFTIDYDRLFAREADAVQRPSPGTEYLELPGPVIVEAPRGAGARHRPKRLGPGGLRP